jgi:hypothetical protein
MYIPHGVRPRPSSLPPRSKLPLIAVPFLSYRQAKVAQPSCYALSLLIVFCFATESTWVEFFKWKWRTPKIQGYSLLDKRIQLTPP